MKTLDGRDLMAISAHIRQLKELHKRLIDLGNNTDSKADSTALYLAASDAHSAAQRLEAMTTPNPHP